MQVRPRIAEMASFSEQESQSRGNHRGHCQREQDDAVEKYWGGKQMQLKTSTSPGCRPAVCSSVCKGHHVLLLLPNHRLKCVELLRLWQMTTLTAPLPPSWTWSEPPIWENIRLFSASIGKCALCLFCFQYWALSKPDFAEGTSKKRLVLTG